MIRLKLGVYFLSCLLPLAAADSPPADAPVEIEQLKKMLIDQQRQIDALRQQLAGGPAKGQVTQAPVYPSIGKTASERPILPSGTALTPGLNSRVAPPSPPPAPQRNVMEQNNGTAPLQLKIGNAYITPVGFMDMTSVSRSTNPGSGIGTNFGSIPYDGTQQGSLTETRFSPQNSRIGFRIDALVKNMKIIGYMESDFLGQVGNPPNGGLAVSSNPYPLRVRLYWLDVNTGKFEFLGGQTWSLLTPGRRGISPLPGDLFYSQDIDVNYQAGLVWGRIPEFRFVYHPSGKMAFAVALDNSEPYAGGGNGGSAITAPSAIAGILGNQVNNGTSVISAAAIAPDVIAKIAFDPSRRFHLELAGVAVANKISNPASTPAFQTFSKMGGGGSINLGFDLVKNFRLVTNNYWSDGGGRYIFGQAPDFIIRSDGSLSNVHSGSTVSGFEATIGKHLLYAYYGGVYIQRNTAVDTTGKLIGYGPLSSDGQNRAIQEFTLGSNTTLWKDPSWGAINLMFQYSYLQRNPWLAAVGAPDNAHLSMGFVNLRYTLPGSAPSLER